MTHTPPYTITPFIDFMLEIMLEAVRLPQVSDQVAKLLTALRKGPGTATELMKEMGLSHRPTFRKNYLHPVISMGLIEMTRPESPTARNQKYRLTSHRRRMQEVGNTNG